jgi:hypothetical protein
MRGHDREEQSSGAGEPFPSPAANAAIAVPDTQNLMAHFVPMIGVVLITIAVHKHDGIDLDQRFRTGDKASRGRALGGASRLISFWSARAAPSQ